MTKIEDMILKALQEIDALMKTANYNTKQKVDGIIESLLADIYSNEPKLAEKKKKVENLGPRGTSDNPDLPDFWRKNYDYGESPYMNLDKIEKITDKPPYKKKKKD